LGNQLLKSQKHLRQIRMKSMWLVYQRELFLCRVRLLNRPRLKGIPTKRRKMTEGKRNTNIGN